MSKFASNILQILGIRGRFLIPPVTQLFMSKWLHFFFQWMQAARATRVDYCILAARAPPDLFFCWSKLQNKVNGKVRCIEILKPLKDPTVRKKGKKEEARKTRNLKLVSVRMQETSPNSTQDLEMSLSRCALCSEGTYQGVSL